MLAHPPRAAARIWFLYLLAHGVALGEDGVASSQEAGGGVWRWGNEGGEGRASLSVWRDNPVFVGGCVNSAQDVRELWRTKSTGGGGDGEIAQRTNGFDVLAR